MYLVLKRILDVLLACLATIILSPLFLIIILLLLCTGEHEVFYRQQRIGKENTTFGIIKFATMVKNSLQIGTGAITLRNDPRVTRVGKYLRMTKMNELPQVFNVFLGDMSIVGPRPLVQATFDAYPEAVKNEIYQSKPGITGIGSVIFRDEEKLISASPLEPAVYYKNVIAPYKGQVELWYNRNKSLMADLKIIFITGWVILFPNSNLLYRWFKDLPKRPF
jgi:lipopolysaccharide/colanic/teichoic acid biosynthesis glycosyltransferase